MRGLSCIGHFLMIFLFSTIAIAHDDQNHTQATEFNQKKYLEQCGGVIYNNCDKFEGPNQLTIFEEALTVAKNTNRDLVIIVGADWCPPCQTLEMEMKEDSEWREEFDKHFVLVKVNGDYATNLSKYYIFTIGYPTTFIYSISRSSPIFSKPGLRGTVMDWVEMLLNAIKDKSQNASLTHYDTVSIRLLNKPIEIQSGIGVSDTPITLHSSDSDKKKKSQAFFNQGLAHYHGFNWVDSYRSFKVSNDLVPSSSAKVGMALALSEVVQYDDNTPAEAIRLLIEAHQQFEETGFRHYEIVLLKAAVVEICKKSIAACVDQDRLRKILDEKEDQWFALGKSHGVTPDLIALSGWMSYDQATVEEALETAPNNSGAHHYIGHLYESQDDHDNSLKHLKRFSELAPKIPHAQHMYGHTLPLHGKWEEAIEQFEKAHQLHLEWFEKNNAEIDEDWHFFHNIDLYSSTLFVMGRYEQARKLLNYSCDRETNYDIMSCLKITQLLLLDGRYNEAADLVSKKFAGDYGLKIAYIEKLMKQLSESKISEANQTYEALREKDSGSNIVDFIIPAKLIEMLLERKSNEDLMIFVEETVGQIMNQGGFDGWAHNAIPYLQAKDILKKMGYSEVADRIKFLILNGSKQIMEQTQVQGEFCGADGKTCKE